MKKSQTAFKKSIGLTMMLFGAAAIGGMFFLLAQPQTPAPQAESSFPSTTPVEVNYPVSDLALQDLNGNPVSLRDWRGMVVLVNLWATWCPPCKAEMPALQDFYETYKQDDFMLVGINQEEPRALVADFVAQYGLDFPIWLDPQYLAERVFNTSNLPSSYVIDRQGVVRLMWVGSISRQKLEEYVPQIIAQ